MPTNEPSFSSKPLPESDGLEPTPRKSTKKKYSPKTTTKQLTENPKQTKINKQLTQIYQDSQGHLPDMKKIKIKKTHSGFKAFFTIILLGGLLAAVAWVGFFLMPSNKKFAEGQINLTIDGPQNVTAGTTTTYKISYENNQSVALKQATLDIQYPEGFVFVSSDVASTNSGHTEWQLNDIGAHQKNEFTITGVTYGSLNQNQSWRAILTYQPENFSSELQKTYSLDITVANPPFSLSVNGPSNAILGSDAEYTFTVKKEYDSQTNKLELKPYWPQNFFITSSSPTISKDNKWIIDPNQVDSSTSETATSWTFTLVGKFSSSVASSGDISGTLFTTNNNSAFPLTSAKTTTNLTQDDAGLNLTINGSSTDFNAKPGDSLNIALSLKNQSANNIKNASLKLTLDAPSVQKQSLLNWGKIQDKFDGDIQGTQISDSIRRGEITWNKTKDTDLGTLTKNQTIGINIQLPIKDSSSFDLTSLASSSQITAVAVVSYVGTDGVTHTYYSNQIIINVGPNQP